MDEAIPSDAQQMGHLPSQPTLTRALAARVTIWLREAGSVSVGRASLTIAGENTRNGQRITKSQLRP